MSVYFSLYGLHDFRSDRVGLGFSCLVAVSNLDPSRGYYIPRYYGIIIIGGVTWQPGVQSRPSTSSSPLLAIFIRMTPMQYQGGYIYTLSPHLLVGVSFGRR